MKLLVVPTLKELRPIGEVLSLKSLPSSPFPAFSSELTPEVCLTVCGMGIAQASACLAHALSRASYRQVILLGVAGVHPRSELSAGELVGAISETYLRLGSIVEGDYKDLTANYSLHPVGSLKSKFPARVPADLQTELPWRHFGTSDWISSTQEDLEFLNEFHPEIEVENMEGAAVAHVCQLFGVEFVELRALVNVLGNRDPSSWSWQDANQG